MFPNSNRKGSQNDKDQELVNTLGNPLASEEDWLHASDKLGDYKPRESSTEKRSKATRHLGEVSILAAMGLGIFALINFTQPSNVHSVAPATPMPVPVASAPAAPEIDYGPYMANLQRTIKRNWFPPKDAETKQVVVLFKIDKAGQLSKLRLSRSSGVGIADQAALKAVEDASHSFKPLPEGAPADVDIEFTFDYNVFNTPTRDFSAEAAASTDTDSDSGSDSSSDSSSDSTSN